MKFCIAYKCWGKGKLSPPTQVSIRLLLGLGPTPRLDYISRKPYAFQVNRLGLYVCRT